MSALTVTSDFLETGAGRREFLRETSHELIREIGGGAYGKVWLARNPDGQWRAVKVVYRANFGKSADPYEREYRGITRYKPISDQHPGLLRVDRERKAG